MNRTYPTTKVPKKGKIKTFDFTKRPKKCKQPFLLIEDIVAKAGTKKMNIDIQHQFDKLPAPCLILAAHMSYLDTYIMGLATKPNPCAYVGALDAIFDHGEWLMRRVSVIGKRKFIQDINLLKNMRYAVETLKCSVILYPESKFTLDGRTSFMPETLGKLIKFMRVPVVIAIMHGNYAAQPQWGRRIKGERMTYPQVPLVTEMYQLFSAEDVANLPPEQMQKKVEEALCYDEYDYLIKSGAVIDDPHRAEGLDKILYRCPSCETEGETYTEGSEIYCKHCNKRWHYTERGTLESADGSDPIFTTVAEWFDYEKECVRKEVESGAYFFEDEVDVVTLPNAKHMYRHPKTGVFTQTPNGFHFTAPDVYGEPVDVSWDAINVDGIHIEYNYKDLGDVLDVSTLNESFWITPKKRNVITKISLATDEAFKIARKEKRGV